MEEHNALTENYPKQFLSGSIRMLSFWNENVVVKFSQMVKK